MRYGAKWVRNVAGKARTTTAYKKTVGKRRSKSTGVVVVVEKGKTTRLPNAFIARGRKGTVDGAGSMGVFQRSDLSRSNSPLIRKASVTIASMFEQKNVEQRTINKIYTVLDREFRRQLDRLIK